MTGITGLSDALSDIGLNLSDIVEPERRAANEDDNYYRDKLYLFELFVPEAVGGVKEGFIFPLVLNPEEYTITEPLTTKLTPTIEGGLYAEEDGIIQREIKIRGHTGFKPTRFKGDNIGSLKAPPMGRSYAREIALNNMKANSIVSGHRHFQFLQDAVFRTYADLKRDPSTAFGTTMNFHVLKDDEHWRVIPMKFMMRRRSRTLYEYEIDLVAVGPAAKPREPGEEDKSLLDEIKDAFAMVNSAVNTVNGVIQDVTAYVDDIARTVSNIGTILGNVTRVIDNAAEFVNGTARLISAPFAAVTSVVSQLDTALQKMEDAGDSFPSTVTNSFRKMQDAFNRIGAHPEAFQSPATLKLMDLINGSTLSASRTQAELEAAAAASPPNSFAEQLALGTGNTVGDLQKARGELGLGTEFREYRSATDYQIAQGDTLANIAGKFLGDARNWRHLAILNGLKYPFISEQGLPGTRKIGDTLLIPSYAPPPLRQTEVPVIGVGGTASVKERVLGTDYKLSPVSGPGNFYDLEIDVEGGSVDLKKVSGIENLQQALTVRLVTERGRDPLYVNLGLDRVIALKIPSIDRELLKFRIAQAIGEDPRIVSVRNLTIRESDSADKVEVDVYAEVRGLDGTTSLVLGE